MKAQNMTTYGLMGEIAGGIMIILGIILIALSFALGLSKPIYSLSVLF
jgi:hypothetical protein